MNPPETYQEALKRLDKRQQEFVKAYLDCLNASEAARRAGYKTKFINRIASENLSKPDIKAAIELGYKSRAMPRDEVLTRLERIARADATNWLTKNRDGDYYVDVEKMREAGQIALIKKVSWDRYGNQIVEFHDPMKALELLGKHHKLFSDRISLENPDGTPIKFLVGVSEEDL